MGKHGGKAAEKEIKPEGQSFAPGADAEKEENSAGQDVAEAIQDASSAQADAVQAAPAEPIVENAGKEAGTASAKKNIFTVKIFNYRLLPLFLMMLCMSLAGFLVENLFRLLRDGVLNSRRQILPFFVCLRHRGLRAVCSHRHAARDALFWVETLQKEQQTLFHRKIHAVLADLIRGRVFRGSAFRHFRRMGVGRGALGLYGYPSKVYEVYERAYGAGDVGRGDAVHALYFRASDAEVRKDT